ncbi:glycoside hydrolase family 2 protein [Microbispora bryophytorum]|uniref:beta-mannosidase n=1 Tax=Microbispora bryophytorum TaxID=1460882 RepID=A0A8H9GVP7_9ACTN|nr:glycoside hydrolase family 2 TIM barrel-domain containing protein [Microbispora bryophytorum]MBD3138683.1 glycoside hydrolase family 2 protein [Microbispora bryophytorum]TQS03705.1 glycoside hydrolase family 2 protein [Microbispora bryophytorum]GGO02061.1 beta-mannosidase [Microbispora bryophytorum]
MSSYRPLHDGWTVTAVSSTGQLRPVVAGLPAAVPGCVHTDLLAAGLIEDPYLDDNEDRLTWIGRTAWSYETTFTWELAWESAGDGAGDDRADLVCEGLDTAATLVLNGVEIGTTANMHRSYRFSVRHLLRAGENTLKILFDPPYGYAEAQRAALGDRPGAYTEPYQFIRKMACNFGWDWGPTVVTAGIWRPIGIETWSAARIAEVRPFASADGTVEVHVAVERATERPLTLTASVGGITETVTVGAGQRRAVVTLTVPDPELWWPRGYGEQPLYDLVVRLEDQEWTGRIGFRSVELDRTDDAFTFVINGRPVFVKGFNWIPDDCFPSRVTRERLAERFGQAAAAGANCLRVWGGGMYESEDFYDLADEMGLLVWQDFPFACAAYPEEGRFTAEVEAEAREHVARLARHASLVLWCGNNENIEGHADWGWQDTLEGRSWGGGFYYDLLPRVVAELDPTRPYWPGSPYSGSPGLPPNDPSKGTVHIWTVWNHQDYTHYATYTPRFVAEFGFQGPPTYATLRAAVSDDPLTPVSPGVTHHQKAVDGNLKLLRGLGAHLPQPDGFDDWHYYTQLNQARAMAFGIERFRALAPHCMGTIVWQLNDCWPVTSWAAVDGGGRRKPLWHALRRAYADRLLTFQGDQGGTLAVVNDTDEPWSGELAVDRLTLAGEILAKERLDVSVPARGTMSVKLPEGVARAGNSAGEVLVAALDDVRALRFPGEDPAMDYPPAEMDTVVEEIEGGLRVRVTARTIVRELALFPDRLDPRATVDDQLVTLLPGETAVFHVTGGEVDPGALVRHPVLRCVNESR